MSMKNGNLNTNQSKYAIIEYNGKKYYTLNDETETVYNEDGSILGKAYEPEVAKILSLGNVQYLQNIKK